MLCIMFVVRKKELVLNFVGKKFSIIFASQTVGVDDCPKIEMGCLLLLGCKKIYSRILSEYIKYAYPAF